MDPHALVQKTTRTVILTGGVAQQRHGLGEHQITAQLTISTAETAAFHFFRKSADIHMKGTGARAGSRLPPETAPGIG